MSDTDNISPNGTSNHAWADAIRDGLTPTDYAQIEDSFKDDDLSFYWPDVKVPDLGIRTVNEPDPNAGKWLTEYVAYAKKRSPISPEIFHEAAGLFLLSAAVARRVAIKTTNDRIYPNLYILLVGPPGIVPKTGAIKAADDTADDANLLMLPGIGTTEGLSIELSFTKQYSVMDKDNDPKEYQKWMKERALAAQRSLITCEASKLFESGRKDYLAQFRELLLELYDCPRRLSFSLTVTRGRNTIENAYLSFLGDTTPAAMRPYFSRNAREWTDGTFSRFGLITFETRPDYQYFMTGDGNNDHSISPGDLPERLSFLHRKFLKMPEVSTIPIESNEDGEVIKSRLDVAPLTEKGVVFEPGVVEAMRKHHKAVQDACWQAYGERNEKLSGLYVRLNVTAVKIAMLLATIDASDSVEPSITISLAHWERAQWISERWRRSLHRVDSLISRDIKTPLDHSNPLEKDATRIESFIRSQNGVCKNGDLQRQFSDLRRNGRFDATVDHLKAEGRIIQTDIQPERGPVAVAYKLSS